MAQNFPRFTLKKLALLGIASAFSFSAFSAQAATEIQFWHAMQSALGERVKSLTDRFNASQSDYKIVPVFKGTYPEVMTAGIAAYRAKAAPHILQVFEVGTATMMGAKGAIKPVGQIMKESGENFDIASYIPAVVSYYSTSKGEMLSFPFNSSTALYYYNKDMFDKAGLDSSKLPNTWSDLMIAAAKLKASGTVVSVAFILISISPLWEGSICCLIFIASMELVNASNIGCKAVLDFEKLCNTPFQ